MKKPQLYQVNSVFQINSGKISESFISRNLLRRSEPKYKMKSNQIIESAIWINPSPPSESQQLRKPFNKSESGHPRKPCRLINPHGENESFRLINTVIENEPRYLRKPN